MSVKCTDVQTHTHTHTHTAQTLTYAQVTVQALFMTVFFTADRLKQKKIKEDIASYTQFRLQQLIVVKHICRREIVH